MDQRKINSILMLQRIINGTQEGKIYLFGAGEGCRIVYQMIEEKKVLGGVIDNNKTGSFLGMDIMSLSIAKNAIRENDLILLTVSDYRVIVTQLEKNGMRNYLVCNQSWSVPFYLECQTDNAPENAVEFYLVDAFEVFHFSPIVRFLNENGIKASIVAEEPTINTAGDWFDYNRAIEYLREEHMDYKVKCNPYVKWAVTTQSVGELEKYFFNKINMVYGVTLLKNKYLTPSIEGCYGFDYKWVHGDVQFKSSLAFLNQSQIIKMGYPKYGEYSRKKEEKYKVKYNIDNKPIIVYLPTWDELSSIQRFKDQLKELKKDYYIIGKMHHCTARLPEKECDRNEMNEICDELIPLDMSFDQFCDLADLMLIDAKSGAATEAAYINPEADIVLLGTEECFDRENEEGFIDEVREFAPIVLPFEELTEAINRTRSMRVKRQQLIDYMYESEKNKPLESILKVFRDNT